MSAAASLPLAPPLPPPAARSGSPAFTRDGGAALEAHLALTCARVLSGLRGLLPAPRLQAVLLGGGYGRGEGGVWRTPTGDKPYNDLEFYVALAGPRHLNELRFRHRLEVLAALLTPLAGVEIEFKIFSFAELAAQPVSMFSYDLAVGHRWLGGAAPLHPLHGCAHHRQAPAIPPAEATRLLMNRCSGLLFAAATLGQEPLTDLAADFVRRNLAKAQLAGGDAILASRGWYHWSCLERTRRLEILARHGHSPWLRTALWHHRAGVAFKLHPRFGDVSVPALRLLHREVTAFARETWLRLEGRRLQRSFPSAGPYAAYPGNKCPGTSGPRNLLLNLRADRGRLRFRPRPWRHPRQRAYDALALLLWEPAALADPLLHRRLETTLHATVASFADGVAAYRALWHCVR